MARKYPVVFVKTAR